MLELGRTLAAVTACHAAADVLDTVAVDRTLSIRVAPDELLLLSAPERAAAVRTAADIALAADGGTLVLDVTDGYGLWSLRGEWREAFSRLCALPPPDGRACLQGLFADVPAKLLLAPDELLIVTSSVVAHHVEARVRDTCADLDPTQDAPTNLSVPVREAAA